MRETSRNLPFKNKSQMAGAILADLYDQYERTKENNLLTETKFFLEISNPIKHIINILENSGHSGTMSIDDAILLEHKLIRNTNDDRKIKITLLSAIENVISSPSIGGKLTHANKNLFILEMNEILANARLFESIGDDTRIFMLHEMYDLLLEEIADRIINREDLKTIIMDILLRIKERKQEIKAGITEDIINSLMEKIKLDIKSTLDDEIDKLHGHLDHVGSHTFEQLQEIKKLNLRSQHIHQDLFDDYEGSDSGGYDRRGSDLRHRNSDRENKDKRQIEHRERDGIISRGGSSRHIINGGNRLFESER